MQVQYSTLYPMTKLETPGLMLTIHSELTMSLGGTKPGREDPFPHVGKVLGLVDFTRPQMLHTPTYW